MSYAGIGFAGASPRDFKHLVNTGKITDARIDGSRDFILFLCVIRASALASSSGSSSSSTGSSKDDVAAVA